MASIYGENIKFICARPFTSETGEHQPGEVVEEAPSYPLLETLIRAGFLIPYAPEEGYAYLPPHVFSAVKLRVEAEAAIAGDSSQLVPAQPKAAVQIQAEREAELQHQVYEAIKARNRVQTVKRAEAVENSPEPAPIADVVAKKTAKKAPAKESSNG